MRNSGDRAADGFKAEPDGLCSSSGRSAGLQRSTDVICVSDRTGSPELADQRAESGELRRAPPYSAFAAIYDRAMGAAVLPSLIDAFSESRRRFGIGTASIADIGCGTGRFLRYLACFEGRLFGIDRSPAMLKLAGRLLEGTGAELLRMDMRALRLPQQVETVTCTFDTVNYLLRDCDLEQAFAGFARVLRPGGTLVLDFIPEGAGKGATGGRQRVRAGGIRSEWRVRIDPEGRGSVVAILLRNGARGEAAPVVEVHRQRWHAPDRVRQLLERFGFDVVDWRPVEPGGSGDWIHVVARLRRGEGHTST